MKERKLKENGYRNKVERELKKERRERKKETGQRGEDSQRREMGEEERGREWNKDIERKGLRI